MPIRGERVGYERSFPGEELTGLMEDVTADVSSLRGDVAELRHQMEIGFARADAKIESELRRQTRFFFLAWAVNLAAIVGLYGTMIALSRP